MYICPDSVTGQPFWKANGYRDSGKIDPDDKKPIYIKAMIASADFVSSQMVAMTKEAANEISQWEYETPYDVYSLKDRPNGYLMDESTWGTEQFCLVDCGTVLGQVSCQYEGDDLWVGWSMTPILCGKGNGAAFVKKSVKELRRANGHTGRMLLRVAAWNQRAIKAYRKAGFIYMETIQDKIAYSNNAEEFWVMGLS